MIQELNLDISPPLLRSKAKNLCFRLQNYGSAIVAYSGGVDSVLLTYFCHHVLGPQNYTAILAVSPSLAKNEHDEALKMAEERGWFFAKIQSTEFNNPDFLKNPENRCFHCKFDLFTHLENIRQQKCFNHIIYGANQDDYSDYRPGHQAAQKFDAKAPMAEAGLTKQEIRTLSKHFDLPTFNKPAMPCLSSRIPYHQNITLKKMTQVEQGESLLRKSGFSNYRVRHEENTARIEIPIHEFKLLTNRNTLETIIQKFKKIGFQRIVLDLEGFRSGNLNQDINFPVKSA